VVAAGPQRTTLWTSLRLSADLGPIGVVVPVPPGASLDHTSPAWIEALEAATAPRVFPPTGESAACSEADAGADGGTSDPFHVTVDLGKTFVLPPLESTVLPDAAAVTAWAAQHGLSVPTAAAKALEAAAGMRFVVERFEVEGGPNVLATSTLRVVMPGSKPTLPLSLTRAGDEDLLVTAWFVGVGRADLEGAHEVVLPLDQLRWDAAKGSTNYVPLRAATLYDDASATMLEATSHEALYENTPIAGGKGTIPGVVTSFFTRAASYGDGDPDPAKCMTAAASAIQSSATVAEACPRADLGVVDGASACVEEPTFGQLDPDLLRCGDGADDLAVALSGLAPQNVWLTRRSMLLPKGATGASWPVSFSNDVPRSPVVVASSVDRGACEADGGASGGSSSSGGATGSSGSGTPSTGAGNPTGGSGWVDEGPYYEPDVGCGCSGTSSTVVDPGSGVGGSDDGSYVDDSTDDCSGDTQSSSSDTSDDCSGDTQSSSDSSSDDCSGDTQDSGSSSDDCSGSSSDPSYEGDDCSSGSDSSSSDVDCSGTSGEGSSSSDCSIAHRPQAQGRRHGPKLSVLTLGALALLAPIRRLRRPHRTRRGARARRPTP
jgi:hypothetical protein